MYTDSKPWQRHCSASETVWLEVIIDKSNIQ
jgi:hypothetical protein